MTSKTNLRIAVDVDGVLFDHVTPLLRLLRERHGVRLDATRLRHWDFSQEEAVRRAGLPRETVYALLREIEADSAFHNPGLRRGAAEVVRGWAAAGHKVHVVTAREHEARESTHAFLEHHGIPHDRLHMGMRSKVGWDVLLDDAPHNVQDAAAAGALALLMDHPYNRHVLAHANPLRVRSWAEAQARVADAAAAWTPAPVPMASATCAVA